ncbi:hypothetical protein ACP70R_006322 [Stipagrostis hirtigluma subsp. patula]
MALHHAMPDDKLALIFLHLGSPIDLLRAASTCKRWRRIITGATFLRRFRSLHGPSVAGAYHNSLLFERPRFVSSPPAAADGRHFSLDFLPEEHLSRWRIRDSRGSLLLVDRNDCKDGSLDMFVCEPLTRRYEMIPPLTPSARYLAATAYLVDGEDDAEAGCGIGMDSFRVFCLLHDGGRIHAGVFTSGGSWRRASAADDGRETRILGVAAGSRYWHAGGRKMVVLDQSTLEFSSFVLPGDEAWDRTSIFMTMTVTAGRDGEPRIVVGGTAGGGLKVFARRQGGGAGGEWALEKIVQPSAAMLGLPRYERCYLSHAVPRFVHRTGTVVIAVPTPGKMCRFRLDIESLEAERVPELDGGIAYPCELPWPPSLHVDDNTHVMASLVDRMDLMST